MNYDFLAQDAPMAMATTSTSTVQPRQTFFQRFLPFFFRTPIYAAPPQPTCVPVPLPQGTLGRDANGNLTVNGQTYCRQDFQGSGASRIPAYYPAYSSTRFRLF